MRCLLNSKLVSCLIPVTLNALQGRAFNHINMKSNQIYNRDLKKQQLICLWEKNIRRALFSLNRVSSAKNKDLWSYYLYCSPSLGAMKIFWLRLESVYVLHLYIQSMSHTKISGIYSQAAFLQLTSEQFQRSSREASTKSP